MYIERLRVKREGMEGVGWKLGKVRFGREEGGLD